MSFSTNELLIRPDRIAFSRTPPETVALDERIIITPNQTGKTLFFGPSTLVSTNQTLDYIAGLRSSNAVFAFDIENKRFGVGVPNPDFAIDVNTGSGIRLQNGSFQGSGSGLTNLQTTSLVGTLPTSLFANTSIPLSSIISTSQIVNWINPNTISLSSIASTGTFRIPAINTSSISTGVLTANIFSAAQVIVSSINIIGDYSFSNLTVSSLIAQGSISTTYLYASSIEGYSLRVNTLTSSNLAGNGSNITNLNTNYLVGNIQTGNFGLNSIPIASLQQFGNWVILGGSITVGGNLTGYTGQFSNLSLYDSNAGGYIGVYLSNNSFYGPGSNQITVNPAQLISTTAGLNFDNISENNLTSTIVGLGTLGYISSANTSGLISSGNLLGLVSTPNLLNLISTPNLLGLVSTPNLQGLVSTQNLLDIISTPNLLGLVSTPNLQGLVSTQNLLDIISTPNLLGLVSTPNLQGLVSTQNLQELVSTPNLLNLISTQNIIGLVSTPNLLGIVSTPNLQNLVSTPNLLGFVSTPNLENLISTQNLLGLVSTPNLQNLISTQNLLRIVSTPNLLNLISTQNLLGLVSTQNLLDLVSSANLKNLVSTPNLLGLVSTPNLLGLVSTSFLDTSLISTVAGLGQAGYLSSGSATINVNGLVSTPNLLNLVSTQNLLSLVSTPNLQGLVSSANLLNLISTSFFDSKLVSTVAGLGQAGYLSSGSALSVNGLVSTPNLIGLVSTQNLQNLVSTANLTNLVSTQNLLNLVSTSFFDSRLVSTVAGLGQAGYLSSGSATINVNGLVSTPNLLNLVSTPNLLNLVSTQNLLGIVSTPNLLNLVSTQNLLGHVSTQNLLGLVSTPNLWNLVSTQNLSGHVSTQNLLGLISSPNLLGLVSTPNLLNLVSSQNLLGLVSTPNLLNLISTTFFNTTLTSTVQGLGASGYISSAQLVSTSAGLQQYISSFIDPQELASSVLIFISTTYFTNQLNSTVRGLGTVGYVSSFFNISSISAQQLTVSSIGIGCNAPTNPLEVVGTARANSLSSFTVFTSSYTGNLGDAQTLILWEV